ncbi:hypothetical protein [Cronobacter sakazakii]|uniref:hypothetical protein n=1 Tax=Cronobacter sakazakii TaxID=28141 RepID=UPI0013A68471|nr:hypothetical protein [Cronobacter sakazakii]
MNKKEEHNQKRVPVCSPFRELIAGALFVAAVVVVFLLAKFITYEISLSMK